MKLMQFLMGLDDSYMKIRSFILSREVLPGVRSAYASISRDESHRVASGSVSGSSLRNQASAFMSNVPKRGNFQRGVNQHMTYTDKELDNVLDISHLKIKVGHPDGTEAFISKIENLKLSNGLILYDVLVIPEYCVTLIFDHKLDKENKIIVSFDESKCYFLNQDLNLKNVLGIGNQCEGLYYYNNQGITSNLSVSRYQCYLSQHDWHCRLVHHVDPVLNVLKDSLQFDNKDQTICCEICQRAKQSRESFTLSEHTSKFLSDLVHLDLWGPYKVTTLEDNIFSEGNLDQNPSTSTQGALNVRRSLRQSVFPKNYNDFVVESKVKYGLKKYVGYSKLNSKNYCFGTQLNKNSKPKSFYKASKFSHWTDAMNNEMDALLRNDTWKIVDLPKDGKALGSKWIFKIKFKSSGETNRYKARLVAQRFGQKEGIDYEETFSSFVKIVWYILYHNTGSILGSG
ncbi:ribonuclease H-like domain-containing protein [Tanacetum coccineum]